MPVDTLDANLLQSAKKPKSDSGAAQPPAEAARANSRRKRLLKGVAYGVFFLWSVMLFSLLKIPDSVIANFVLNSLNQNTPYRWQAESMKLGIFPFPHLRIEKLTLEPKFPGGGFPLAADELRIYPNPFSLIPLGGPPAVGGSFSADAYKANLHGSMSSGNHPSLRLESGDIDLAKLTPISHGGNDLRGLVTALYFQLSMPNQRLSLSDGEITLKAKNIVFDPASLEIPMALPVLNLGDVDIHGIISRGQLKIERFHIGAAGKDLEVQIPAGTVTLADISSNTRYELHMQIRPSAAIAAAVPALVGMLDSFANKHSDGFYGLLVAGSLSAPAPSLTADPPRK